MLCTCGKFLDATIQDEKGNTIGQKPEITYPKCKRHWGQVEV